MDRSIRFFLSTMINIIFGQAKWNKPYSLTDWPNTILTSKDEKASSCFVQNVTGKRSCTDDEETSHHNSEHSQEHKNSPESTIDWRKARREGGGRRQYFLAFKEVTYLAKKDFSPPVFTFLLKSETLILFCIYVIYHEDQIRCQY